MQPKDSEAWHADVARELDREGGHPSFVVVIEVDAGGVAGDDVTLDGLCGEVRAWLDQQDPDAGSAALPLRREWARNGLRVAVAAYPRLPDLRGKVPPVLVWNPSPRAARRAVG